MTHTIYLVESKKTTKPASTHNSQNSLCDIDFPRRSHNKVVDRSSLTQFNCRLDILVQYIQSLSLYGIPEQRA